MEKMTIKPLGGGAKESDSLWQLCDNEQASYCEQNKVDAIEQGGSKG
jgi:hypothetical protein